MKVVVTGGGSGGHIYPALAIAEKFKKMDETTDILYIGSKIGIESTVVPQSGFRIEYVDAYGLFEKGIKNMAKTSAITFKGFVEAGSILNRFKPDIIVGTGGYVCVPVILAGRMRRIKSYIHEQNAFPGRANRYLEKYVSKIFMGFAEGEAYFKNKKKLVYSGNPVRKSFFSVERRQARKRLGFSDGEFVVLSFAGSLGAEKISDVMVDVISHFNGEKDVRIVFAAGKYYSEEISEKLSQKVDRLSDNIDVKSYIDDMENYLAACDVLISRAGALTLAETTVCGAAAIMIPSPNVAGNHQYFNAKSLADKGGAILMEEEGLTSERVIEEVESLRRDKKRLESLQKSSREAAMVDSLDIIYESIMADIQ